jgi:outer membrane protein assembly factor BamB
MYKVATSKFRVCALFALLIAACSLHASEPKESSEWMHRTAHNYAIPLAEDIKLTDQAQIIRPFWEFAIHTGIGKSGGGTAMGLLKDGFSPTFGDTASAVVADGVYLLSWSEATGDISARPGSIHDRYFRGEKKYKKLAKTYFRIDANWNTIALDAATGEKLWQISEPSASMNFVSSKRDHNGIDPAAGSGVYVTVTVTGRIFAYDIKTGKKRWEGNVGEWYQKAKAFKTKALAQRNIPHVSSGMFGSIRSGLVVVDDIVVVPDLRGGLIGLNAADGQERWRIGASINNRQGCPRLWKHEGKTYVITYQRRRYGRDRGGDTVTMIDPSDGRILWTHKTGYNQGDLIMGEDMVLLNPSGSRRDGVRLAAYRISAKGLTRQWQFPDDPKHKYFARGDRSAERKGVIDDGRLYIANGFPKGNRKLAVYDLATGRELYRSEGRLHGNVGHPVSYGDKLYWQVDSSHSGPSGILVYQKNDDGSVKLLGEVKYETLGVRLITDYENPIEIPFANGHLFLRGKTNLVAADLCEPVVAPARVQLKNAWAGYVRPVEAVWVADPDGNIEQGRVEIPIRDELGVPGTTARRKDLWDRFDFADQVSLGGAWETTATVHMDSFSYPLRIVMQKAKGSKWNGQWTRSFAGWDKTLTFKGKVHDSSVGGYSRRCWPTRWLDKQPMSFFSDLEEGQERVILQFHQALPLKNGERRGVTICVDHDGKQVISAVAGAFAYSQSYIEVDTTKLQVTPKGLSGTAHVILSGDRWWQDADWVNGGSLLGQLTVDAQFGKRNDQGLHPVSGTWSFEWGISAERSGPIRATIGQ